MLFASPSLAFVLTFVLNSPPAAPALAQPVPPKPVVAPAPTPAAPPRR